MNSLDAVIVGAGAAGIAAARALRAAGWRIAVLEARSRAGGRAVVDRSMGVPVDLGAAWLHFAEQNVWTQLAQDAGLTVLRREPGWGSKTAIGSKTPTETERAAVEMAYGTYHAAIAAVAAQGRDVPVSEVIPNDAFRPRFDAIMTWAVGVESREVSTVDLARYADSTHNWAVREGLGAAVAKAAANLPIHFDTPATMIDWQGERVKVAGPRGTFEARTAIVTVPTTALARGGLRFTPELPASYRDAIANLPLGVANKVFFELLDARDLGTEPRHFIGCADSSRTGSYAFRPAEQPMVSAYFGGDLALELETRGALIHFARDELQRIFGAHFAKRLGRSIATAWGSDPFARGSYSAARPGYAHCRELLAKPVTPRLWFAGEACSLQYYGTLYGAWLSGTHAAEQALATKN